MFSVTIRTEPQQAENDEDQKEFQIREQVRLRMEAQLQEELKPQNN